VIGSGGDVLASRPYPVGEFANIGCNRTAVAAERNPTAVPVAAPEQNIHPSNGSNGSAEPGAHDDVGLLGTTSSGWTADDWQALFNERAGNAEFDRGYRKMDAELIAYEDCGDQSLRTARSGRVFRIARIGPRTVPRQRIGAKPRSPFRRAKSLCGGAGAGKAGMPPLARALGMAELVPPATCPLRMAGSGKNRCYFAPISFASRITPDYARTRMQVA
jgi:hypothetical protein